jgi:predicted nucleotidyltransferase
LVVCAGYPSVEHEHAAERIAGFFSGQPDAAAVLLTCSCARGKATRDSCLDIAVLVPARVPAARRAALERAWEEVYEREEVFAALRRVGAFSHVDLDVVDGRFVQPEHGWMSGADAFELEIGNLLAYSVPLWEGADDLARLRDQWLPYYGETLRLARAAMVRRFFENNLDHIPLYVERGLYFQSHYRLMLALGEFLQALFIARRTYPIAYDKWIAEQIVDLLGLPDLYRQLVSLLEIERLESDELARKGDALRALYETYCV